MGLLLRNSLQELLVLLLPQLHNSLLLQKTHLCIDSLRRLPGPFDGKDVVAAAKASLGQNDDVLI